MPKSYAIYYSSSRENDSFERKIRNTLKETCELPIISVTQKPVNLGKNICVGERPASTYNTKRQIYEGLRNIDAEYVWMAEADFIYPKEYFEFKPEDKPFYCFKNIYVIWHHRRYFYTKIGSEGAMICNRKALMENMETYLDGWDKDIKMRSILKHKDKVWVNNKVHAVTFKTGNGCSDRCPYIRGSGKRQDEHWGFAGGVKDEYI